MSARGEMSVDRPIRKEVEDRLGRTPFARQVAAHVAFAPLGESLVFAVHGSWGSGKSSVLNLIETTLSENGVKTVQFNPWMFAGAEDLVLRFLGELGAELSGPESNFKALGEKIVAVGKGLSFLDWIPGVPAGVGKLVGGLGSAVAGAETNVTPRQRRRAVEDELRSAKQKFVVFIDDVDRLSRSEIRELFRAIRLVADFPNVSYVLSYDRRRVERALDDEAEEGGAYLAKIVQASFDLPAPAPDQFERYFDLELRRALGSASNAVEADARWARVRASVLLPLMQTPRDVKRLLNSVGPALALLADDVSSVDVLALEALRVFLPNTLEQMVDLAPELCGLAANETLPARPRRHTVDVSTLVANAGTARPAIEGALRHVFPMGAALLTADAIERVQPAPDEWRRARRVAHRGVFETYIHAQVPAHDLSGKALARILNACDDEQKLKEELEALELPLLELAFVRARADLRVRLSGGVIRQMIRVPLRKLATKSADPGARIGAFADFAADHSRCVDTWHSAMSVVAALAIEGKIAPLTSEREAFDRAVGEVTESASLSEAHVFLDALERRLPVSDSDKERRQRWLFPHHERLDERIVAMPNTSSILGEPLIELLVRRVHLNVGARFRERIDREPWIIRALIAAASSRGADGSLQVDWGRWEYFAAEPLQYGDYERLRRWLVDLPATSEPRLVEAQARIDDFLK